MQARETRLYTSNSPGKATTCTVAAAVGRAAGSNAVVAGQRSHSRRHCGIADVGYALLVLSSRTSDMKSESAAVFA